MMAQAFSTVLSSVPSEIWDDDFEFQQAIHPDNTARKNISYNNKNKPQETFRDFQPPTSSVRISTTSSHFTEDWDTKSQHQTQDDCDDPNNTRSLNNLSNVPGDKSNLNPPPAELNEWAEPGPSTPSKRVPANSFSTENWDDDFEDNIDSPARRSIHASSPSKKLVLGDALQVQKHKRPEDVNESWDDEFGLGSTGTRTTPVKTRGEINLQSSPSSITTRRTRRRSSKSTPRHSVSDDGHNRAHVDADPYLSSDDDDLELGYADREDDRTVTARSRRAALSRLTTSSKTLSQDSPPPPVPAIPSPFLNNTIPSSVHPHPFPRSPTSSVFSVPTTITDTRSYDSTTHLRPISRASSNLGHLPPSPPIHKERERRRLRKKSRPHPAGMFEMVDMHTIGQKDVNFRSFSDGELGEESEVPREQLHNNNFSVPRTPSRSPSRTSLSRPPSALDARASSVPLPSTPSSTKGALLSRIGSVKKWGIRRKRESSVTSREAANGFGGNLGSANLDPQPESDVHLTPRPRSSLSSFNYSTAYQQQRRTNPTPPPSNPTWFFRASSAESPASGALGGSSIGSRSGSMTDLSLRERERERASMFTPSPDYVQGKSAPPTTPSKLLKRKSFGFVQLRRGFGGHGGGVNEDVKAGDEENQPVSLSYENPSLPLTVSDNTKASGNGDYGSLGLGRAAPTGIDDSSRSGRERRKSSSRSRSRDPFTADDDKTSDKGRENEGRRGFIGSVRKISLVGRHKRNKSGAALTDVREGQLPRLPASMESRPSLESKMRKASTDRRRSATPNLPSNVLEAPKTPPPKSDLLPPIELQPPSPPQAVNSVTEKSFDSLGTYTTPVSTASVSPPSGKLVSVPKTPVSPQSASLGRSTVGPSGGTAGNSSGGSPVPRRSSLGDLKIPARISQAQVSLRRDLGMVREFAAHVEQLKDMQITYNNLVSTVQAFLDDHARLQAQRRATTKAPSHGFLKKSKSRRRSNTNPDSNPTQPNVKDLASAFYTINSKYRISWECAELLIELGGGTSDIPSIPSSSISAPAVHRGTVVGDVFVKKGRDRAITLAGDESKPPQVLPTNSGSTTPLNPITEVTLIHSQDRSWRASTGRHDLSQRQLGLLREMLSKNDPLLLDEGHLSIPEESTQRTHVDRKWRWGDPMSSTVTLPSEESVVSPSSSKKRRSSRLGMSAIRDMLRSLKKNSASLSASPVSNMPPSSTSLHTDSSLDSQNRHQYPHPSVPTQSRRRAKTSTGPETLSLREREGRSPSPYRSPFVTNPSPRRPSIASIFRLGQKSKATTPTSATSDVLVRVFDRTTESRGSGLESSSTGEEDWDRMDSASDLDAAARGLGDGFETVRRTKNKSPYLHHDPYAHKDGPKGSHSSIRIDSASNGLLPTRPTRLSNVEEHADDKRAVRSASMTRNNNRHSKTGTSPSRPPSRIVKNGSVRSMPPQSVSSSVIDPKLALTPDNIKPLLENAKEVYWRLNDCISEIRAILPEGF